MRRIFALSLVALAACSRPAPSTVTVHAEPRPQTAAATPAPAQPAPAQPQAEHHEAHGTQNAAPALPIVPGGTRRFGEALSATAQRTTLPDALRNHQQIGNSMVRVEGQIVAVCQHMGCWMEIRDASTQAHVRMHGHSFFLPRDVNGKRAAMSGTIVAAHNPTECDESAREATGRVAQIEFDAHGVEVYD